MISYNSSENLPKSNFSNISNFLDHQRRLRNFKKIFPCTALAIDQMIQIYNIDCYQKNVVILGRSYLVGTPISSLFFKKGAYVNVCDINTLNIKDLIKNADILVSCTGNEIKLTNKDVKNGLILFDVGVILDKKTKKIRGDIDIEDIKDKLQLYTPVPGGLGPLTVANMILNLYQSFLILENNKRF